MTPQALARIGQTIYGRRFKAPLARALGIDRVTLWRYLTGQLPVPVAVSLAVKQLRRQARETRGCGHEQSKGAAESTKRRSRRGEAT